jgi:hypothetical protein
MPTGATGQLGLALPVQGELSGTWGNTVNNAITEYTNIAIAATLTLTNDGAVTLANTTGTDLATNITSSLTGAGTVTAQFAIVRVTGTLTTAKVVTAPSYSKTYVVVNAATGGIVTFKASGQTGVSIAVGESAWVYYNGTDYVKLVGTATAGAAGGSTTQVQYNSSGVLAGSANMTFDGTSMTLGGNPTLSAGTANGVTYLNGSKVLTSGSALVFDGTNLGVGVTPSDKIDVAGTSRWRARVTNAYTLQINTNAAGVSYADAYYDALNHLWQISGTEGMRLTTTGLGIGTSSPSYKLHVQGYVYANSGFVLLSQASGGGSLYEASGNTGINVGTTSNTLQFITSGSTRATIDSSGNLGLGVTPSAWGNTYKAFQAGTTSVLAGVASQTNAYGLHNFVNCYNDNTNWIYIASQEAGRYEIARNVHKWFNAASGTAGNTISFTQAMTLDADGDLGIGVTSPAFKLDISGGGTTAKFNTLDTYDGGASLSTWMKVGRRAGSGTNAYINTLHSGSDAVSALAWAFGTSGTGTEVMRLSSAGGFSVGTTADPGAGAIYATGNITAYYSSDIKFKENVRDIPNALATVNAIGGKLFDWKDDYIESKGGADGYFVQKADFGVVAQDVQKVFPIAVRTREDGSLAVDYEKLGALAFAALVELTKRVEALEAK